MIDTSLRRGYANALLPENTSVVFGSRKRVSRSSSAALCYGRELWKVEEETTEEQGPTIHRRHIMT